MVQASEARFGGAPGWLAEAGGNREAEAFDFLGEDGESALPRAGAGGRGRG